MTQTPAYIQAALTTESISKIGKQIHRTESRLWALKKAIKHIPPYCLTYKNMDLAEQIILAKEQAKNLREAQERLKKETPKSLWYPRRKYCGRYNNRENDIKTKIMKDCFRYGFNVKEIAGYFNLTLPPVYRRIKVKLKREF